MCGYFGTKKKSSSNRYSPLNNSIEKEIVLPNYPLIFLYLNIEMCGYFGTKKNSFTKLSFSFVST